MPSRPVAVRFEDCPYPIPAPHKRSLPCKRDFNASTTT